jgi:hypothetical protein
MITNNRNGYKEENLMRVLEAREPLRDLSNIIARFKEYVNTYESKDAGFHPETFINDMLYGIGSAMSEEYTYAKGYRKFKERLKEQFDGEV